MYKINPDEVSKLLAKLRNSWVYGDECDGEIIVGGFARSIGDDCVLTFDPAGKVAHLYVNSVNMVHFACKEHTYSAEDAEQWASRVWHILND